jgi:hypothetical protein
MRITQVTTVKDRREHVLRHIGRWLASGIDELVLVDWNCPEETGKQIAQSATPGIRRAEMSPSSMSRKLAGESFHLTKARNVGALAARHELLLFMDADTWASESFIERPKKRWVTTGATVPS